MKLNYLLLSAVLLLLVTQCSETGPEPTIIVNKKEGVSLTSLTHGQRFSYLAYQGDCDNNFSFTGDTIHVTVEQKNDSIYLAESFSEGSPSYYSENLNRQLITLTPDYVLIPERSNSLLLFFYGNDTIHLTKEPDVTLTQNNCRLMETGDPFIGDHIGWVDKFEYGQVLVENSKGISCVPPIFELEAYIFYEENLSLIHVIRSDEQTSINGFVAL